MVGIFLGGGSYAASRVDEWFWGFAFEVGLIGVLVLFAGVALLVTTRYPGGLFEFILGLDRWVARVAAYVLLMRDEYPPFRLDQGGADPRRWRLPRSRRPSPQHLPGQHLSAGREAGGPPGGSRLSWSG